MTRSYRVLALALVSMAVLLGLAKLIGRSSDTAASAAASSIAPSTTASSVPSTGRGFIAALTSPATAASPA